LPLGQPGPERQRAGENNYHFEEIEMTAKKSELFAMVDRYEADPDGSDTCDLLCQVLDSLPDQPEGEFTPDEVRELIAAIDD
jgi:hypothetical protein